MTATDPLADWQNEQVARLRRTLPSGSTVENHEPSAWLQEQMGNGPVDCCPHIDMDAPRGLFVLQDRFITCGECETPAELAATPGEADLRHAKCDRCDVVCPSSGPNRRHVAYMMLDWLTVAFALCRNCAAKELTEPPEPRNPIVDAFLAYAGPDGRVPGGCDVCDAYQTLGQTAGMVAMINVHHDDDCPVLARHQGRQPTQPRRAKGRKAKRRKR